MTKPPRAGSMATPIYAVAEQHPMTLFASHYDAREREPDRTAWNHWRRAPHNTLRTWSAGSVIFDDEVAGQQHGYEVDLDQCTTNDHAWAWIQHLAHKNWASTKLLNGLEEALFDLGYITGFPSWSRPYDPETERDQTRAP